MRYGESQGVTTEPGMGEAGLFSALLQIAEDGVLSCDSSGRVARCGTAVARLFGLEQAEVLGQPLWDLFSGPYGEEVGSLLARALRGETVVSHEVEVIRADGLSVPVALSACRAEDPGCWDAVVVVLRDLTEQRLAQAALAETRERLEAAESLSNAGSWVWDVGSGVVQWSASFHRLHEVDPLEFDGTLDAYLEAVHPDDRLALRAAMERSLSTGRPFEKEYRVPVPGGQVRVIRVRAVPTVGPRGTVIALSGVGREAWPSSSPGGG